MCKKFILLGAVSGLSMPPFCIFPIIILSYGEIFNLLLDQEIEFRKKIQSFGLFLFTFNAFSMYWLYKPFLVANMYLMAMPFLLFLLFAYLSVYHLTAGYIFGRISAKLRFSHLFSPIIFACIFIGADFLIGTAFGGFPWNFVGYSAAKTLSFIQISHHITIYGLNFLFYLLAGYISIFLHKKQFPPLFIAISLCVCNFLYGAYRLSLSPSNSPNFPFKIGLVSTNIPQRQKWDPYFAKAITEHLLSESAKFSDAELIIWPEAAFPYAVKHSSDLAPIFSRHNGKSNFLIGTIFTENHEKYFNSMVHIGADFEIKNTYHKIKLTPFGEYIPFRWIPGINLITTDFRDFSSGTSETTFRIKNTSFYPIICYEAIFPINKIEEDYIVNISNDAWFEDTIGIDQLFLITRFRAIESGKTLIRVSNKGPSAVIDRNGRTFPFL